MQFWMWGQGPAKAAAGRSAAARKASSRRGGELPPSAVPHISQGRPFGGAALTASPRGEKPCPATDAVRLIEAAASFSQRLLP